jgi:hypothetical protein
MPDDPDGKVPDQKEQYRAYTDQRIGALPKAFAQLLCAAEHTSHFPEYDKLPGAAYIGSGDAGVSFASSLLGAFNGWEYSLLKKGKRCAYTFEPTAKCAEELGGTPWDWFCILPACKVVEHNADETDGKTGELRWKVERGKRKTKIAFTTEAVENMKRGGW